MAALPELGRPEVEKKNASGITQTIFSRRSPELFIALNGPMGSGVSEVGRVLEGLLVKDYAYKAKIYKVSQLIAPLCAELGETPPNEALAGTERVEELQNAGNKLREKFGNDVLARAIVRQIARDREQSGFSGPPAKPLRMARIIDGLKHPDELKFLFSIYGKSFWLVGVFASEEFRTKRLKKKWSAPLEVVQEKDSHQELAHGQKVRDLFALSSYFIRNDSYLPKDLEAPTSRFLSVLLRQDHSGPSSAEVGMAAAALAGRRSACLSRQVGAAVYSEQGELLGVGWNDVPKFGGGLYASDSETDNRCYQWGGDGRVACHNDAEKHALRLEIFEKLKKKELLVPQSSLQDLSEALKETSLRDLLEFSRSVHAEMEALLSLARRGLAGVVGGTLYTTTFPCHNCARHIVASGVRTVYYIEPYPKSKATKLHSDSIVWNQGDDSRDHVCFLQFEGFAPRVFSALFGDDEKKKHELTGVPIASLPKEALPRLQPQIDSFIHYEQMVVQDFMSLGQNSAPLEQSTADSEETDEKSTPDTAS